MLWLGCITSVDSNSLTGEMKIIPVAQSYTAVQLVF